MPFYPSEVPALLTLAWPSGGLHIALMISALALAAVLGWLVLSDRRPRLRPAAPVRLVSPPRKLEVPRAAA